MMIRMPWESRVIFQTVDLEMLVLSQALTRSVRYILNLDCKKSKILEWCNNITWGV